MRTQLRNSTNELPARPAQPPRLPRSIALVNASVGDPHGATQLIIDDFAEAFEAYANLGAAPGSRTPQPVGFAWDGMGAFEPSDLDAFDAVILGYGMHDDDLPVHTVELLNAIEEARAIRSGTRLYVIASTDRYEPRLAGSSLRLLGSFCERTGIRWSGGLAAGASDLILVTAGSPRMGCLRRRLSEATDRLILAVRCGTDAGTIEARCPIPRFAYKLAAESRRRAQAG